MRYRCWSCGREIGKRRTCPFCGAVQEPVWEEIVMEPLLPFFEYEHLPPHLQEVSGPFFVLAHRIVETLPRNSERTVALRKLLEAKDCALRLVKQGPAQ